MSVEQTALIKKQDELLVVHAGLMRITTQIIHPAAVKALSVLSRARSRLVDASQGTMRK